MKYTISQHRSLLGFVWAESNNEALETASKMFDIEPYELTAEVSSIQNRSPHCSVPVSALTN